MDAVLLSALAEPNRLRIVELLRERPCSVNDIAGTLNLRQPQTSKHLQALTRAGWVTVRPKAQQRIYVLRPEAFISMDAWLASFERHWKSRFTKLDTYLEKLKEQGHDAEHS